MGQIVTTRGLTKTYEQGDSTVYAVRDANIQIMAGEMVALTGRSGAGKSTLLRILGGLEEPTDGEVFILGQNITRMNDDQLTDFRLAHIGFVFQNFELIDHLTALENIRLPLDIGEKRYDTDYEASLFDMLEISGRLKFRPGQLSGGQKQRVAIARALICRPEIIFADEPTGNLDKQTGDHFIDYIMEANRILEQTFVVATHDAQVAGRMHRVIRIEDGTVCGGEVV